MKIKTASSESPSAPRPSLSILEQSDHRHRVLDSSHVGDAIREGIYAEMTKHASISAHDAFHITYFTLSRNATLGFELRSCCTTLQYSIILFRVHIQRLFFRWLGCHGCLSGRCARHATRLHLHRLQLTTTTRNHLETEVHAHEITDGTRDSYHDHRAILC